MIAAPLLGAVVYAWFSLASAANVPASDQPTLGLVFSGVGVGLLFEVAVLLPLLLALQRRDVAMVPFVVLGGLAWFALCFVSMLVLGLSGADASSTATVMFLPGATIVVAFWLLARRSSRGVQ